MVAFASEFIDEEKAEKEDMLNEIRSEITDVMKLRGVRLIGSNGYPAKYYGRVEVFMHGQWGTVCDDYATNRLARAVCRGLFGHDDLTAEVITNTYDFSNATAPFHIWMDDVQCSGHEWSIYDCQRSRRKHDCSHKEDVAVNCGPRDILPTGPAIQNATEVVDVHPTNGTGLVTPIHGNGTAGNGTGLLFF